MYKNLNFILFIFSIFLTKRIESNPALEINMIVKGAGNQKIFYSRFSGKEPNEVFANGEYANYSSKTVYYLTNYENHILMKWDESLNSYRSMFQGLSNITQINITFYKNSLIIDDMGSMFYSCSSLESIYFNNIDTSKIKSMSNMFYGCHSLTYIDLSAFNTSKVESMNSMFSGCSSLEK